MTENERRNIHSISERLQDVIKYLKENDPKYFTDEDFDSLTLILSNIAKGLSDMALENAD